MKSLTKALDIMELFGHPQYEMSLGEIASLSGYDKSTVYRIVSILKKRGYLQQQGKRGKYLLGNGFLEFSGIVKRYDEIRDIAIPYMKRLSNLTKESVLLAVWNNKRGGIFTETFYGTFYFGEFGVMPKKSDVIPLHCSSLGKIILANMSKEDFAKNIKDQQLEVYGPNTIVDVNTLKHQLRFVKLEGIAYDEEEYAPGVSSVASEVKNSRGVVIGGLGILGPSERLSHDILHDLGRTVRKYTMQISESLGYQGNESAIA